MTVTIVETPARTRAITGGVDTHAEVHVAAALDPVGGLLGVQEFPAAPAGYAQLLGWLCGFGTVCLVGVEGTGSYGAGLAQHLTAAGGGGGPGRPPGPAPSGQVRPAGCTRSGPTPVEVDHALSLPLLRRQRSPSRARGFAVGGVAVQARVAQ
jgi:hypothetical protein